VNFLVDAQLPGRLARQLRNAGHDAIHCEGLPSGNRSSDAEIAALADADDRVVVTKDRDFRDAHLLRGVPRRLLLVVTGNISNDALMAVLVAHLPEIVTTLEEVHFVEMSATRLVVHDDRPGP